MEDNLTFCLGAIEQTSQQCPVFESVGLDHACMSTNYSGWEGISTLVQYGSCGSQSNEQQCHDLVVRLGGVLSRSIKGDAVTILILLHGYRDWRLYHTRCVEARIQASYKLHFDRSHFCF